MQHAGDLGPAGEPARHLRGPRRNAVPAAPPWCAARAGPRYMSSGPTHSPIVSTVSRRRGQVARLADTVPSITSECPPIYLVPDLNRQIDAFVQSAEIERARPGIVHQHDRACGMGRGRDRRHVLHLERQRSRRFHVDGAGGGLHQRRDAAADQRVVIARGDSVAREHAVAEFSRGQIDAVGDQHVVARLEDGQERERSRGQAGGQQRDAGAFGRPRARPAPPPAPPRSACRAGHTGSGRDGRESPRRWDKERWRRDKPAD